MDAGRRTVGERPLQRPHLQLSSHRLDAAIGAGGEPAPAELGVETAVEENGVRSRPAIATSLGYYIQIATGDLRMDLAFAIILVLAALGLALFGLVVLVERLLIPWHVSQRVPPGANPRARAALRPRARPTARRAGSSGPPPR